MAYNTAECLEILLKLMPPGYVQLSDVLAGGSAQMAQALTMLDEMIEDCTVEDSDAIWLDQTVYAINLKRANGEENPSLIYRAQNIEKAVIKASIKEVVDTLLLPYVKECEIIEHFADTMRFVGRAYVGETRLRRRIGFTVVVPMIGSSMTHIVYAAIATEVDRIKAGGMPWWLKIES